MLKLSKVDQIGIVVKDMEKTKRELGEKFGIKNFLEITATHENAKLKIGLLHLGNIQIELIQVLEGESIHTKFLEEHGEGIHHLGFYVKNLDEALNQVGKMGLRPIESGEIMGVKYAYLNTEEKLGFTIELIQIGKGK